MPQNNILKVRRGLEVDLPSGGTEEGELRYSIDTKRLYIDDGSNNILLGILLDNSTELSTATQTALDNKADLVHTHVEADITDLDKYTQAETDTLLLDKVDKVIGKQLSTEDYTSTEKTKLAGIAAGAEVNVNADWNAISGDAQILNKPSIPSIIGLATISYVDTQDNLKVDKVAGKSLIDDVEITRLSTVVNFDNSSNITALADKVDKIPGKGLSTNDYTNIDQTKVSNLSGVNTGDNATNSQYSGLEASKQDVLVSGTNIKTINSESLLGSGDIVISSAITNNFIQDTAPTVDPGITYTWWDTSGGNLTLWVENGL